MNIIRQGKEEVILATGSDENILGIEEIYSKVGVIASDATLPFDNKDGFTLSDGSITLVLEQDQRAISRNAKKYAEVLGYGMATKAVGFGNLEGSDMGLVEAIHLALADANLTIDDIDTVAGFANGYKVVDSIELNALEMVFGSKVSKLNVIETKQNTGDARSASAALSAAVSALLLSGELDFVNGYGLENGKVMPKKIYGKDMKNVLSIAYSLGGTYTAIIITK
jgi:3-oxoacyl-[acyl-carrier-protein] synthase II